LKQLFFAETSRLHLRTMQFHGLVRVPVRRLDFRAGSPSKKAVLSFPMNHRVQSLS
jgi:hypothetical protein